MGAGADFETNNTVVPAGSANNNSADVVGTSIGTTISSGREVGGRGGGEGGATQKGKAKAEAAPGWDHGGSGSSGRTSEPSSGRADTQASHESQQATTTAAMLHTPRSRQAKPVSARGERSFLEAFLDGGHSPATAVAAGLDPAASARGVAASVAAEAVTVSFVGATVVLGPVVGRVTQRSAVVLVEVGSTAAVGCVLADGVTGRQHRQVRRKQEEQGVQSSSCLSRLIVNEAGEKNKETIRTDTRRSCTFVVPPASCNAGS